MAVRQPLYYNASNQIQAMTTNMVEEIVDQTVYQYSLNPSVTLSVVGTGGSLDSMSDTRLQAGASSTSQTSFPPESATAEPSVVTVTYDKISETRASVSPLADTGGSWPVYYNANNQIQSMNLQDVKDTFLHPAIDKLVLGTTTALQGGTYHITTSNTNAVSNTAVFSDTRANTGAYTAGAIPEALDQPTTLTNYYLHQITGSDNSFTLPLQVVTNNNLQSTEPVYFKDLLQQWIRYTAVSSTDGYSISYNINGTGNNRGSGMADTRLNGSGNYQTRFANSDDYRAQEFPNGTATTINTYYLKINKS